MATPLPAPPVGPDTLITVKVLQNNSINRRFKIPLRDLGARVFPERVRCVLAREPSPRLAPSPRSLVYPLSLLFPIHTFST